MLAFFGIIAGILSGIAVIPYVRDILLHKTKPERASWLIWSVLGSIAFFSQLAEGATWSLWLTGINTIGVLIIFILAIKYGMGGLARRDTYALIAAGFGLILWYLTRHAFIALFVTIGIDLIGQTLTVIKTYAVPESETLSTWVLVSTAGIFSMLSVGAWDWILLLYPFYIFLANFSVVVAIYAGRNKKRH